MNELFTRPEMGNIELVTISGTVTYQKLHRTGFIKFAILLISYVLFLTQSASLATSHAFFNLDPGGRLLELRSLMFHKASYMCFSQGLLMWCLAIVGLLCLAFNWQLDRDLASLTTLLFSVTVVTTFTSDFLSLDKMAAEVDEVVNETLVTTYFKDPIIGMIFDEVQQSLKCCGSVDPKSWASSQFNGIKQASLPSNEFRLPKSCCSEPITEAYFTTPDSDDVIVSVRRDECPIFTIGCSQKLVDAFRTYHSHYTILTLYPIFLFFAASSYATVKHCLCNSLFV